MGIPAPTELILILLIVVLVFGGKKIPEIMGGVAEGIKTFKKALDSNDTPPAPPASPLRLLRPSPQRLTRPRLNPSEIGCRLNGRTGVCKHRNCCIYTSCRNF